MSETLKKDDIDTVIVNQALDKILTERYNRGRENLIKGYYDERASIKQQYQNRKEEGRKVFKEFTRGLFTALFWIGIVLFAIIGLTIAVWGFKGAIPMIVVGSIVVCWLVVMLIYNLKMKKQATKVENIIADCTLLNQILDAYETHFDLLKIHEKVDSVVISKLHKESLNIKEQFDIFTKLISEFTQKVQTAVNDITYLPKGLNRALLPRMVELLESGLAIDYRSALQLAENK